mmetsp:Transcript_30636/g.78576  ORF Transcript_30636/g.78576 Transcript_30636/m.78576 type:complete len:235 (+) Transcript_30636:79-783(+)
MARSPPRSYATAPRREPCRLRGALLLMALLLPALAEARRAGLFRPCTPTITQDCLPGRFVECNATRGVDSVLPQVLVTPQSTSGCNGLGRVQPQEEVVVQFTKGWAQDGGPCLEILVRPGECWGQDGDGDAYDCMGQCGPSCQKASPGVCSNWSLNCLRHDVCSYYYNSEGGALDESCGHAFGVAVKDYLLPCLIDTRCEMKNFNTFAEVCAADTGASLWARYESEGPAAVRMV